MSKINWSERYKLEFVPNKKMVSFTAFHQAQYTQYIQIEDAEGNPISFTTIDRNETKFPISGTGTEFGFFEKGVGYFMSPASGCYYVRFANEGSNISKFLATSPIDITYNGKIYGGMVNFVTEDGGGTDYNDTSFDLEWYTMIG